MVMAISAVVESEKESRIRKGSKANPAILFTINIIKM